MATELFSRLKSLEEQVGSKRKCRMGALLAELYEADAATADLLAGMLDNPKFSTRQIHAALQADGRAIDRLKLGHHRDRVCSCYRNGL